MHYRTIAWIAALIVLLAAIGLRLADPPAVARLRTAIFDTYLRLSPRAIDANLPVRIVAIDESSIAELGQWPWPRTVLADIVERLKAAGARSITFDLILAEADRMSPEALAKSLGRAGASGDLARQLAALTPNDARLAAAMAGGKITIGVSGDSGQARALPDPRVSLVTLGDDPRPFVPDFKGGVGPIESLVGTASGIGAVNWVPSDDQIVRRVPLLLSVGGKLYPSLSLEAFRVATGQSTVIVKSSGASGTTAFGQQTGIEAVRIGQSAFPTDSAGETWLNYSAFDLRRYISAARVIDGSFDAAAVQGRDVLIGATAAGLHDIRATPLDAAVPGVEIHAQALEQMLSGAHLVRPAWTTGLELSFIALAGIVLSAVVIYFSPLVAAVSGIGAIALFALASWRWFHDGILVDPLYPSIAVIAAYLTCSLPKFVATEAERSRIRSAFQHYLAPPLVEELARHPERLKLGGETRELTVLFADVRGFTTLSEGMTPEQLVRFMNNMFDPLGDAITNHGGTIDKFMGDAVMAFWNAPLRTPGHAAQACRAALAMQAAIDLMNENAAAQAAEDGKPHVPVRIGIGLNTGDCSVGNMGSSKRFDYSALGDPVNMAARFQYETKAYDVPVIAGAATAARAGALAFLEIGQIVPRGATRAEAIYALIGGEALRDDQRFIDLRKAHARLLGALRTGDIATARVALADCRSAGVTSADGLLQHYSDQLAKAG